MNAEEVLCDKGKQEHHSNPEAQNGCCENHSIFIEGQDEVVKMHSIAFPENQLVAVFYVIAGYFLGLPFTDNYYFLKEYSPPLIERDIPVFVQSFLL